jgi:membrane-associated phospholipid phosphatase
MQWGSGANQAGASQPVPRPLLPGPLRWPAAALVAACAAVTTILGLMYHGQSHGGWLDGLVDPRVQSALGRFPGLLHFLADCGHLLPTGLIVAALVLACLAARRWPAAVLAAVAEPIAIVLTDYVLKPLIGRTLSGWLSFPSGHATAMFALAVTSVILLANPGPAARRLPAAVRGLIMAAALLAAATVAIAMVALNAHYITDAIGGTAIGTGIPLACALILDLPANRRQPRQHRRQRRPQQHQPQQPQQPQQQTRPQPPSPSDPPRPAPAEPRRSAG